MIGKSLVLSLLVYVSLDFAAPLMPGAIYFEDGTLTVVPGDRCRADQSSLSIRPAPATRPPEPIPTLLMTSAPVAPLAPRTQRRTVPARRPPSPSETSASSTEDH